MVPAYARRGDLDGAISDYRKTLALDPGRTLALQGLKRLGVDP